MPLPPIPSPTTILGLALTLLALLFLHRALLPKPIPGIPYNKNAATSLLGDIPAMSASLKENGELYAWMTSQCHSLNSPIIQLFIKPLKKPWVVVADARECQDVLGRRGREFDRAKMNWDVVQPILREHHFPFPSGPKQKAHRALLADLMGVEFLHKVAAPQLYKSALELVDLWRRKTTLAKGYAFEAEQDVSNAALDTIWAAAVGTEAGTTMSQLGLLNRSPMIETPKSAESPIHFPEAPYPPGVQSMRAVIDTMGVGVASPIPWLSYFFYLRLPWVKRHFQDKDKMLQDALEEGQSRLQNSEKDDDVKSAMDYILKREILISKREKRPAQYDPIVLKDELFGFLLAGHETTSTTISWALKFLADHQSVQDRLRNDLRASISEATATRRQPTYEEIISAKVPYLDACIEEFLRCGNTASAHGRMALVDTEILGVQIPKGTDVIFMTNGPGFLAPPMHIDENLRTQACRDAKDRMENWDPMDVSNFKPERWLKVNEEGVEEVDLQAGPNTQFGGGARGCFGRKFAYLEMRTMFSLLIWNFKLLPVAPGLSSYRAHDGITHRPQQCYVRLELNCI